MSTARMRLVYHPAQQTTKIKKTVALMQPLVVLTSCCTECKDEWRRSVLDGETRAVTVFGPMVAVARIHAKSGDGSGAQGFSKPGQTISNEEMVASKSRCKAGDGEAGEGDGWEDDRWKYAREEKRGRSALFSNRRNFGGVAGLVSASEGKRGGVSALWPVQLVFMFS